LLNPLHTRRFGLLLARTDVLLSVVVLVCVPALTRIGQKLEPVSPISHAPSFSGNIDCPPKKVTVAPVFAMTSPIPIKAFETVPVARLAPLPDATLPRSPNLSAPHPPRAPPSALLV
jgi:hypothetical protein